MAFKICENSAVHVNVDLSFSQAHFSLASLLLPIFFNHLVATLLIIIIYMPNTVLGGRANVLTTARWGEVRYKPSYSIQHARAGIEEDETIALGVHLACLYLPLSFL